MEEAFEDLRRLLAEAEKALEACCGTTVRAYVAQAQAAARGLMPLAAFDHEEKRIREACTYSELRVLGIPTWGRTVEFLSDFWEGFEDGLLGRTQSFERSAMYDIGHDYGAYGHA